MYKKAIIIGAFFGALSVVLGAFAAHGLKAILPEDQIKIFETGVRYQFYHAFALLMTGLLYAHQPAKMYRIATNLFTIGILLFSGSLYLMTSLSVKGVGLGPIGIITPIGGLFFIAGWVCVMWGTVSYRASV